MHDAGQTERKENERVRGNGGGGGTVQQQPTTNEIQNEAKKNMNGPRECRAQLHNAEKLRGI